jgi:hypothetical protein
MGKTNEISGVENIIGYGVWVRHQIIEPWL